METETAARKASLAGQGKTVFRSILPTLIDIFVPLIAFFSLGALGVSNFWALTVGGSLSVLHLVVTAARDHRLNYISMLILLMFAVGIGVTFLTHDPRILLIKPSFFFISVGGYLLASCFVGKPMMYEFIKPVAAGGDEHQLARYELTWERVPKFRKMMRVMTAVWGVTWIVESVVRVVIVYSFPEQRVGEALVWTIVAIFALVLPVVGFTAVYGRRLRTVGEHFNKQLDTKLGDQSQSASGDAHQ